MLLNIAQGHSASQHKAAIVVLALLFGSLAYGARAELLEPLDPAPNPEYFNLWDNSIIPGNGPDTLADELTRPDSAIWLCGTENCADAGYGSAQSGVSQIAPAVADNAKGYSESKRAIQWETMLVDSDGMLTLVGLYRHQ